MTVAFKTSQIRFEDKYDGEKLRRFAAEVAALAQRVATLTAAQQNTGSVPSSAGQPAGNVLSVLAAGGYGWAVPVFPGSISWNQIQPSTIPTSFPPAQHLIADNNGLGPAHTIAGAQAGWVLLATGSQAAKFAPLSFSQLGDVNVASVQVGNVPQWNGSQWVPVSPGNTYSGLVVGQVFTATSATTAAFQQLLASQVAGTFTPSQVGLGIGQYGINPAPTSGKPGSRTPTLSAVVDNVLTGDGYWKSIPDIDISWSQISDVPAQIPPPPGLPRTITTGTQDNRAPFLRGDDIWVQLRPQDHGAGPAQAGINPHATAPLKPQSGKSWRQLNLPQNQDSVLAGGGRWVAIADLDIGWEQISNIPGRISSLSIGDVFCAGSDTWIQYNRGGKLGASSQLTWTDTTKTLFLGGSATITGNGSITIVSGTGSLMSFSAGSSTVGNGGNYLMQSGSSSANSGAGGSFTIVAGGGGPTNGTGGGITFEAGSGGNFSGNGGEIDIFAGNANGSSQAGNIVFSGGTGTTVALSGDIIFLDSLSNKVFVVDRFGHILAAQNPLAATQTRVYTGVAGFKSGDSSAVNNTLTADAALTLTLNEIGVYAFEVWLPFYEATVSTGGFKFDLGSGTATVTGINYGVHGFDTAALANAAITSTTTATASATVSGSATAPSWYLAKGWMNVTGAGTIAVRWAQNSTLAADPTTLKAGAYFKALKIG